jgi:hypothetical protein
MIDFTTWSDAELEIGLRAGRRAGPRRSTALPSLIAEMDRRGLDTTDPADAASAAIAEAFFDGGF